MSPDNKISPVTPEKLKGHRIGVFEDNTSYFESLAEFILEVNGVQLERIASNMTDAMAAISRLVDEGFGIVIVDGNFTSDDQSNNDGQKIIAEIKRRGLPIVTIGHTFRDDLEGADHQMPKIYGVEKVAELLTVLLENNL